MRQFSPAADSQDSVAVDLTPMLDVVFILLIFFIVTAVFVREQGLDVGARTPDTPDRVINDTPPIVVDVLPERRLLIAGKDVDERLIEAQLSRLRSQAPEAVVVIRPRADAVTDLIVRVMDSARSAGIANVKFASQ